MTKQGIINQCQLVFDKLKSHKSPGIDQIPVELIKLRSMFVDQSRCNLKITTGTLSNFLVMQIEEPQGGIFLCQHVYMEKVLERFNVHDANPLATPCDRSSG